MPLTSALPVRRNVQWDHVGEYRILMICWHSWRVLVIGQPSHHGTAGKSTGGHVPGAILQSDLLMRKSPVATLRQHPQYEELVFQALCELALVHLISYKGDVNVTELIEARWVLTAPVYCLMIDQSDRRRQSLPKPRRPLDSRS